MTLHETVLSSDSVAHEIDWAADRPWREQWQLMLDHLERLRRAYAGETLEGNPSIKRVVQDSAVACRHVLDHLQYDADEASRITKTMLWQYYQTSEPLKIVNALAVTTKHHTADDPTRLTAYVDKARFEPGNVSVPVVYFSSTKPQQTIEALELAERSVAAWRGFLASHGIKA
ncbi:hypothetical protein ACI79V_10880 [Geodermatophilus sp. SYSU D00700]